MELTWQRGKVVIRSQTQRSGSTTKPPSPPILCGSGSGGGGGEGGDGGENVPIQQNLFIREDEMMSWLQYPLGEDEFFPDFLYSGVAATSGTQLQSSTISEEQLQPVERRIGQIVSARPPLPTVRRVENETRTVQNFVNFSRLRGNINEAGPSLISQPVVRELTQVDSSATPSSSATESCTTPATETTAIGGITHSFAVSGGVDRKGKAIATETVYEISGTPSSGISKAETELVQVEPVKEMEIVDDKKRKEREESEETKQACGSTSTKRSRAAEVHNLSERRRRDRINEKMKALQELIPRCNKSDKASMLDDAIEYMKSMQLQLQMMQTRCGMTPMMYAAGMQQFMPHMAMGVGMNQPPFIPFPGFLASRPLPPQAYPSPRYPGPDMHAFDPSRVYVPGQQSDPLLNQAQFSGNIDPYSQFGLPHMQRPPLQNQQTSQPPSFRPLPTQATQAHLTSSAYPSPRYPVPNIPFDPSRVSVSSQQPYPLSNQAQFSGHIDPYSQFVGLHQMQQPSMQPPSSRIPSSSKEPENQNNHPTG